MQKKSFLALAMTAFALGGCLGNSGGYPAAQTATGMQNNAALIGSVVSAMTGTQTSTPQTYAQQGYAQQGYAQQGYAQQGYAQNNQIANVLGAVTGTGYGQQGYAQGNQLAGVLGAVSGGGVNVNQLATQVLANQCVSYINTQSLWQTARMALGNQAAQWEGQICQCAAQETLAQMDAQQLNQLAMSAAGGQAALTQGVANLMSQTAMSCLQRVTSQNLLL